MAAREVFLPLTSGECPHCHTAVDGISFGYNAPRSSQLRPCGHYVEIEDAGHLVDLAC